MTPFLLSTFQLSLNIIPWFFLGSILAYIIEHRLASTKILSSLRRFTIWQIIVATILGMVSPLSIMSFLPVARSLVKKGVHPSLLFSFLMSERSYDLQSFFIIAGFFGLKIAVISAAIIFASLLLATFFIKDEKITFHGKNTGKDHNFLSTQVRLFLIVFLGILVSAACKAIVPSTFVFQFAHNPIGALVSGLAFGFVFYLGPVITNYPVAKVFAELGMAPIGIIAYLTISPILNSVILVMFSSVTSRRLTLLFVASYTLCAFGLLWVFHSLLMTY